MYTLCCDCFLLFTGPVALSLGSYNYNCNSQTILETISPRNGGLTVEVNRSVKIRSNCRHSSLFVNK